MERTESWRPLFTGRRDGTVVQFICFNVGGFAIFQGEQVMRLDPGISLESALDRFLGMIDRPTNRFVELRGSPDLPDRLLCA